MRLKISKRLRQQLLQKAIAATSSGTIDGQTDGSFLTKREMKKLILHHISEDAFVEKGRLDVNDLLTYADLLNGYSKEVKDKNIAEVMHSAARFMRSIVTLPEGSDTKEAA